MVNNIPFAALTLTLPVSLSKQRDVTVYIYIYIYVIIYIYIYIYTLLFSLILILLYNYVCIYIYIYRERERERARQIDRYTELGRRGARRHEAGARRGALGDGRAQADSYISLWPYVRRPISLYCPPVVASAGFGKNKCYMRNSLGWLRLGWLEVHLDYLTIAYIT